MTRFLIRRILQGLFVMWLMTVTVFLIFFVGPGPAFVARVLAGRQATPVQVAAVAHRLLLDRPLYVQYAHFLGLAGGKGLLQGNLGYDYYHSQSVNSVLASALPITLSLVFGAAILWLAMGLASGIVSAVRTRSIWDRTFTTLALTFYSMPTFVLGLLLILGLYYELTIHHIGVFPAPGTWVPLTSNPLKWAQGLILPWLTLALVSAATYTRLTRGSMLDVFGEDYIRTARSKGMSERRLRWPRWHIGCCWTGPSTCSTGTSSGCCCTATWATTTTTASRSTRCSHPPCRSRCRWCSGRRSSGSPWACSAASCRPSRPGRCGTAR